MAKQLCTEFDQNMKLAEWSHQHPRKFLPHSHIARLVTLSAIRECVPGISPGLADFVFTQAAKVFAILIHSKCYWGSLRDALQLCSDYGLTDETLPIPEIDGVCFHHERETGRGCEHKPHLNVFHESDWGISAWGSFYDDQWHFLAPVFRFERDRFGYNFPRGTILPILKFGVDRAEGHFGSVTEASIDEDHLVGYPEGQKPTRVAIKKFVAKELDPEVAWNKEKEALEKMRPHQHLNDCVAAVALGDEYLLISRWADGGDLQKLWQANPFPEPDVGKLRDILIQFKGLASALQSVHGETRTLPPEATTDGQETRYPPDPTIPRIEAPDDGDHSNWRHGDLKPANVFVFLASFNWPGILKIGDLGLAKRHLVVTAKRTTPSTTEYGTQAYEPPEALTGGSKPRSRLYDIWSFGCVLMETIVWLLYGYDGLQELSKIPIVRWRETLYYSVTENSIAPSAEVNRSMRQVMEDVLEFDPECNSNSLLRDLILLVKEQLLVVALPGTQEAVNSGKARIDAGRLVQELTTLVDRSKMPGQERSESPAVLLQEAIQLTRDIGLEYLWVDALCIIQGPGGDFNDEAERMEQVFSAAYCVIAASRAKGVSDGFLGRRAQRKTVMMPNHSLFLCEDIDDFQQDVIDGHLNQRGWVLQERALARRTIYFAERQTYWECGKGVRCETFTRMTKGMLDAFSADQLTSKQASFLGDSDFPRMAEKDTKGGRIVLFESLYEQYCRLKFTNDYDKPIAIAGLERRLCRAFDTDGGFGLFNIYLERSLLWQRDIADTPRLTKIEMPPGREYVPSWSWMAYRGSIKFLNLPFDGIEWAKSEYRSPWTTAPSSTTQNSRSVRDRSTSTFQVITRNFDLDPEEQTKAQSGIVWDGEYAVSGPLKCVVIGKLRSEARLPTQMHYTLVLKQIDQLGTFERVGVGCLTKDKIHFGGTPTWSVVR
ncbi:hypothetical protein PRZ48_012255 [Zasmidium cellare]|uniref:Protein kinase domain-containing protein n=1 Tax=Zasmidium cellare TaxID=395010 RepID=A0ABR0E4H3_ZASCE|nr:hypothetical protein PRZ48_012255 [Zasmidium cellare]